MKTRVLIYAPMVGRGGVHRMVTRLAHEWVKVPGFEFTILSQRTDENGQAINWPSEMRFEQIDGGEPPLHPRLFPWLYAKQPTFYAHWQRMEADLTYIPMPWWTARVPYWKPPMPTVLTLHDFAWDQLKQRNHEFTAEARVFAQSGVMAAFPSYYQMDWGRKHYGFKNTRTIYHGSFLPDDWKANPVQGERVTRKYDLPSRYVLAFHVANEKKDPMTIIAGVAKARQKSSRVPPLVLAGLDSEMFIPPFVPDTHFAAGFVSKVRAALATHNMVYNKDYFVVGQVDEADIGGLYAAASATIVASHNEGGVAGSMFEAFAAFSPCVYTDLDVFRERLQPDEYGWVFKPGDSDGLCDQLVKVITSDIGAVYTRANKGYEFATSRTWNTAADEYIRLFEEVLTNE